MEKIGQKQNFFSDSVLGCCPQVISLDSCTGASHVPDRFESPVRVDSEGKRFSFEYAFLKPSPFK